MPTSLTEDHVAKAAMSVAGLCAEPEVRHLYRLALQAPPGLPMVELGTCEGRTTLVLCAAAQQLGSKVITIDNYTFEDPWTKHRYAPEVHAAQVREMLAAYGCEAEVMIGDSADVPDGVDEIGLLFIDSEHTAERFSMELGAWLPLLVKDGIAAFHDYNQPTWVEMTPAIDEVFRSCPQDWEFLGLEIWLIGFRRLTPNTIRHSTRKGYWR